LNYRPSIWPLLPIILSKRGRLDTTTGSAFSAQTRHFFL
jgi:hypothetical protein